MITWEGRRFKGGGGGSNTYIYPIMLGVGGKKKGTAGNGKWGVALGVVEHRKNDCVRTSGN